MWGFCFLLLLGVISFTEAQKGVSVPECATSCWENTKYVTKCMNDIFCLCEDAGYQNSLFQCLYSQCDTVHFGSALHFAISQCVDTDSQIVFGVPPIPNHDSLRKRKEAEYLAGGKEKRYESGISGIAWPTESSGYNLQSAGFPLEGFAFPTQSASYLTQSANFPVQSVANSWGASAIPSPTPDVLLPRRVNYVYATVSTIVTARTPSTTKSVKSFPTYVKRIVHTGVTSKIGPCLAFHALSTVVAIYLSL
ncbi:hypothetical protein HYFRA_00005648 [Hymenoscyphus fraxineus]|uniref:CFEM domain-containing protein n=1 Tax=Hymenoscyphus fraxineus TaxID=746836 RepID=A0A9N9PGK2_9HELO|nr:hypothetical protein HYFRA_00005648 [Hymenoscyphus fraxineus]